MILILGFAVGYAFVLTVWTPYTESTGAVAVEAYKPMKGMYFVFSAAKY